VSASADAEYHRLVVKTPVPSLRFEREAWNGGATWVAGVDEVGCGPIAGPVAAGVVALPAGRRFRWYSKVRDSKVLPESTRDELSAMIRKDVPFAIGWASVQEIDRIGILPARRLCMLRAFEALGVEPDAIISDALDLPLRNVRPVIHGDALSVAIAAASIVAKVERDALMTELCERYPGYKFCQHKGYSTPEHKRLLRELGPSPIHRTSYAPVAQYTFDW
jgi:ribonuclease HII